MIGAEDECMLYLLAGYFAHESEPSSTLVNESLMQGSYNIQVTYGEVLPYALVYVRTFQKLQSTFMSENRFSMKDDFFEADNTLRIHRANSNHVGKYVCTASNPAGETELAASLNILSAPVIAPGQISYNLIQGNPITLPCEVKGEPMPKITWLVLTYMFPLILDWP